MKRYQRGFGTGVALFFIAVLTAASAAAWHIARSAGDVQYFQESKDAILAQKDDIVGRLIACRVMFPNGDNGTGYRIQYPAATAPTSLSELHCPGEAASASLWSGENRVLQPGPIPGFTEWHFVNDSVSARLQIAAVTDTSQLHRDLLVLVAERIGAQASVNGATLTIAIAS
ncbi:hypothetical protein RY831_14700 [Noviherbaspirillum sp. CPCC 100848]|uniref:Uncharacterized protein n=1 Tax=Noviherbaspirillum album TaxID=3080276 RepID=A0ABU6J9S7_9BURK|nr:hypothetical protein [Noviherbaspirillum sp. CPCC 100848]MEC4720409.1 hypothetical protein [Noviherbaspirillum sp. CPCC 100848]